MRVIGAALLDEPHHDGSDTYVLERPNALGGEAVVRLRVPRAAGLDSVGLRWVQDGEPRFVRAEVDVETELETWWRARFPVANPVTRYRWLLHGQAGVAWLSGIGLTRRDVPDADDFVINPNDGAPEWHLESVVYQIFPDRFASSGLGVEPPEWAIPRRWDELPTGRGPETPFEWFGGDLRGIEQHLDHIESLGANVVYFTPIFPAGSTHRYDATTYEHVDPLLGGDEALASLLSAAHVRGFRVIGDLTTNHTGDKHEWFIRGERELYLFDESGGYESWLGVKTLPKLNWQSPQLRARMLDAVRRWLDFGLDGWRIDVANMTGRYRDVDVNAEVAGALRDAVGNSLLLAEHGHDFRADLDGRGWHGVMNYSGFLRPIWFWLRGDGFGRDPFLGSPAPRLTGDGVVETMHAFRAGIPWQCTVHSWTLLDSHDTARFRTVTSSRDRHIVGIGLQMTMPGVPMVFAGDEIGLEGEWAEDARRTMPWDRPDTWDGPLLEEFRSLIALRRSSDALARGGIRYAYVDDDVIAYLREAEGERLLCLASRDDHEPVRLPLAALGCSRLETLYGADAAIEDSAAALPAGGPAFSVWTLVDG